jgi:L-malate glycosyltransferase
LRLLHTCEFYAPSVGGAQEVVRQISERLVARGHSVTVATTALANRTSRNIRGVEIEEFAISGNSVRGMRGEIDRYRDYLRRAEFDVMLNYAAQQWTADLAFDLLEQLPYRTVLAPCGLSGLNWPKYSRYMLALPAVFRRYDHLILHSETNQDAMFVTNAGIRHWSVIPNGASSEEFETAHTGFRESFQIGEDKPLLLTVGTHTGLKGHSLTIEAFRQARIDEAVLVVIGNRMPSGIGCYFACKLQACLAAVSTFGGKRVLLLDLPRRDVLAAFHAADLFVFGSAVECAPLVLYEAMAATTPFVTVACGNAAEIAAMGSGVVVESSRRRNGTVHADASTMARAIERLIADRVERHRMASIGRAAWSERLTWGHITDRYEELYERLLSFPKSIKA